MVEPIRVLHVLGTLNRGGAESMIMNLYRNIDREKVQFDFVIHTTEHCDFTDEIITMGGNIYSAPRYNVKNSFIYIKWWKTFFKEHNEYKIIHGHMYSIAMIYLSVAKKFGLITIAHSHSSMRKMNLKEIAKKVLQFPLRNVAHWLFACSDSAGVWLYGKSVKKRNNYIILKNAIDVDKFLNNKKTGQKIRAELGIEDRLVIGHTGRFFTPKNHMYLLEVFNCVVQEHQDSVLLLVGDGELREKIENKAQELGVKEKVIMTGVRNDVNEIMQAMDCFVFPSVYEGLPVTVVEAQAAGLPCLISDSITDEVCITNLVTRISIKESAVYWSNKIFELIRNVNSKDVRKTIEMAGYDIHTTSKWLSDFYLKVMSNMKELRK